MNDFIIEELTKKYIKAFEEEKKDETKIYVLLKLLKYQKHEIKY